METIREMIRQANAEGFIGDNAEAKVCQDIVLMALSKSSLSRNATIKGGVVMRSISNDSRRATQDMDIDFIRYSLGDEAITRFIQQINCLISSITWNFAFWLFNWQAKRQNKI